MYGNRVRPGIREGDKERHVGSIWLGAPESTWFRTVTVKGEGTDLKPLPLGSLVKEVVADGTFVPIKDSDIATAATGLPGARLAVVSDENVKTNETGVSVLIGITGRVDQSRLLIGDKKFEALSAEQRVFLREQLEVWGFALETVQQS